MTDIHIWQYPEWHDWMYPPECSAKKQCNSTITMCTVSMIGDHYKDKWSQPDYQNIFNNFSSITRAEFNALKKEVMEMKELLKRAKLYDEINNEPNCEIEDKVAILRKIAEMVGIDLNDILKDKPDQV